MATIVFFELLEHKLPRFVSKFRLESVYGRNDDRKFVVRAKTEDLRVFQLLHPPINGGEGREIFLPPSGGILN